MLTRQSRPRLEAARSYIKRPIQPLDSRLQHPKDLGEDKALGTAFRYTSPPYYSSADFTPGWFSREIAGRL